MPTVEKPPGTPQKKIRAAYPTSRWCGKGLYHFFTYPLHTTRRGTQNSFKERYALAQLRKIYTCKIFKYRLPLQHYFTINNNNNNISF